MTFIYAYIFILALWPAYEYCKLLFYVSPEDAKAFHRMHLRSRGKLRVPETMSLAKTANECYNHLIIESLNYQTK